FAKLHDRAVVVQRHALWNVERELSGATSNIENKRFCAQLTVAAVVKRDVDHFIASEAGLTLNVFQAVGLFDAVATTFPKHLDDIASALPYNWHVDGDVTGVHAIVFGAIGEVRHTTRCDECFGWCAAPVHTGATSVFPF